MCLVPLCAAAQDTVYSLSLREAQNYAVKHNREVMNSSLAIRQAEASRWQSIASMLPQISGKLDYTNTMNYQMSLAGMSEVSMPSYLNYGATVGMGVSGAQIMSTEISKIAMRMADVQNKQSEQDVAEQVKTLYYSALVSAETIELLERNLESLRRILAFTEKAVEVGTSEKVDADQITVQVASMENSLSSSKRALELLYNSMRLALALDADSKIVLSQNLDELMDIPEALKLLHYDFNMDRNYSFQLMKQNVEMSKKQVTLTEWAYGPTLSAYYQYTGKHYFSNRKTFNMTPPNVIGLSLSIPIFSSGVTYAKVKNAKYAYEVQRNNLANLELSLDLQYSQYKFNLTSAYERYETQKKSVQVSQSVLDNVMKKYEFGFSSALDVTNAGTNLTNAQTNYVSTLLEFVNAQVDLEQLLNVNILYDGNE